MNFGIGNDPSGFHHDTYRITPAGKWLSWRTKSRNWIEFDLTGRMTSFGSRTGMLGKLLYDADERGKLLGIADRNDRQIIWF